MKAVQVTQHGDLATLKDIPRPAPAPDQVLVKIHACALNFSDLLLIKGTYQETPKLPFSLGMECSGTIVEKGREVIQHNTGDRVAVYCGSGGLAEFGAFPASACRRIPEGLGFNEAAAFQIAYGTSHIALKDRGQLKAGETVVILGAAGGVGLTAVQIAKALGARVIAVARGKERLQTAKKSGADILIDSDTPDIYAAIKEFGGTDVVYDAVGGDQGVQAFRALKQNGRHLIIGFASGEPPKIPLNIALVKNIDLIGLNWGAYTKLNPEALDASLEELFELHEKGALSPTIGKTFDFDQALEALDALRNRQVAGKIVVTINS